MIALITFVSVQDLKFTLAVTKMKGYFEAFFEQPPPFKLSLIEISTEETVWSATIREGTSAFSKTNPGWRFNLTPGVEVKIRLHWFNFFCMYLLFIRQLTKTGNIGFICKLTNTMFRGCILVCVHEYNLVSTPD